MNKLLTTLVGVVAGAAMLPALAGPDWQAIEHSRKNKRAQLAQEEVQGFLQACSDRRLVPRLDQARGAQTTPNLNEQRRQGFGADAKACVERGQ